MATKRRGIHATNLNFRPNVLNSGTETKGTKPTCGPTSIKEILTLTILHVCKKSLFFDTNLKVAIYLGSLFIISLIADVLPFPKIYLSRSDNVFNRLFVKFSWAWNLALLIPFVLLTSLIYCCGDRAKVAKLHLSRLGIATLFWYFWTSLFNYIEASYGKCGNATFATKTSCLLEGHVWNGFDLSGHSLILIYGSLMIIEETRCIVNWDCIKEHLRLEDHYRATRDTTPNSNPLRNLSDIQLRYVKENYEKFTPYIRGLLVAIALLQFLWDIMLLCTMLYYHIMIEKFLGGLAAILTWFVTYRFWYNLPNVLPKMPGEGDFRYMKTISPQVEPIGRVRRTNSITEPQGPMFMGRPIYAKLGRDREENNVVASS
nr:unnamed protein product [Callosobruchus chinensis]